MANCVVQQPLATAASRLRAAVVPTRPGGRHAGTHICSAEGKGRIDNIKLRAEVESPWRAVRFTTYGLGLASTGIASLVATTQLIAALGGAQGAFPLEQAAQTLGIDVLGFIVFGFLFQRELKASRKQMARMTREENLSECQVELANGKLVKIGDMRSFSRVVIAAGTPAQVAEAVAAAEPWKQKLRERSVFIVPCPVFGTGETPGEDALPEVTEEDMRYMGNAVRLEQWRQWFDEQLGQTTVKSEAGLYVGLRFDGRVRASGSGPPPWDRMVVELAPEEGMWKGLFDGMDGKV